MTIALISLLILSWMVQWWLNSTKNAKIEKQKWKMLALMNDLDIKYEYIDTLFNEDDMHKAYAEGWAQKDQTAQNAHLLFKEWLAHTYRDPVKENIENQLRENLYTIEEMEGYHNWAMSKDGHYWDEKTHEVGKFITTAMAIELWRKETKCTCTSGEQASNCDKKCGHGEEPDEDDPECSEHVQSMEEYNAYREQYLERYNQIEQHEMFNNSPQKPTE